MAWVPPHVTLLEKIWIPPSMIKKSLCIALEQVTHGQVFCFQGDNSSFHTPRGDTFPWHGRNKIGVKNPCLHLNKILSGHLYKSVIPPWARTCLLSKHYEVTPMWNSCSQFLYWGYKVTMGIFFPIRPLENISVLQIK